MGTVGLGMMITLSENIRGEVNYGRERTIQKIS
jgi:hypothetical protein